MLNPNIKTKIVHSLSKPAWNIVGVSPGKKYKIARIPYIVVDGSVVLTAKNKQEALLHAHFISHCFNNADNLKIS